MIAPADDLPRIARRRSATTISRDISLAEAARRLGRSRSTLRAVWHEIPTAIVTSGGRCYVAEYGLEEWQRERSNQTTAVQQ